VAHQILTVYVGRDACQRLIPKFGSEPARLD